MTEADLIQFTILLAIILTAIYYSLSYVIQQYSKLIFITLCKITDLYTYMRLLYARYFGSDKQGVKQSIKHIFLVNGQKVQDLGNKIEDLSAFKWSNYIPTNEPGGDKHTPHLEVHYYLDDQNDFRDTYIYIFTMYTDIYFPIYRPDELTGSNWENWESVQEEGGDGEPKLIDMHDNFFINLRKYAGPLGDFHQTKYKGREGHFLSNLMLDHTGNMSSLKNYPGFFKKPESTITHNKTKIHEKLIEGQSLKIYDILGSDMTI